MRVWGVVLLGGLMGCAASHPVVVSAPIPDELGWSAPQVAPEDLTPPPPPERPPSAVEQVASFEEGTVYPVKVAVKSPLVILLQPGERIDHVVQDRAIIPGKEDGSEWAVAESKTHTPPRPVVIIHATKAGLMQGLSITTDRRVYLLDVRSVAAAKVRPVRWDYGQASAQAKAKPRLLPDLTAPQTYYNSGYRIEASGSAPSWMPRQVVNEQQGKTYIMGFFAQPWT